MVGDESSEQLTDTEWKPAELCEVLDVLGCFEGDPLGADIPKELMDLDSIELENTLDDNFDDGVVHTREDQASLEMSDGSLLVCSVCVVRQSAYLLDMSKVRFASGILQI